MVTASFAAAEKIHQCACRIGIAGQGNNFHPGTAAHRQFISHAALEIFIERFFPAEQTAYSAIFRIIKRGNCRRQIAAIRIVSMQYDYIVAAVGDLEGCFQVSGIVQQIADNENYAAFDQDTAGIAQRRSNISLPGRSIFNRRNEFPYQPQIVVSAAARSDEFIHSAAEKR